MCLKILQKSHADSSILLIMKQNFGIKFFFFFNIKFSLFWLILLKTNYSAINYNSTCKWKSNSPTSTASSQFMTKVT